MLPEVPLDAFRVGSQFFVLTRQHARMVVGDERRLWEKFKIPCVRRDVCYPEEHFFPTLISMSSPRGVIPATLTHVDWKGRSDGHPRTYFREEVSSELIQRLRSDSVRYGDFGSAGNESNSNRKDYVFLFARKFSPDCLQPLMDLAKSVIFRD
ncbi:hypothetical protein GIB67_037418 [Kingdonia uniflora]|uniref:Uncharacterized protein n=1 Tax=Kingdonia uniflora TaxID=39325 RepID=A0A7J7M8V0_9MAGN|nr:hypothetical protein GIB67_037418 [Kingdonia uniflora]